MDKHTVQCAADWLQFCKSQNRKHQDQIDQRVWNWSKDAVSVLEEYGDVDVEAFAAAFYHVVMRWEARSKLNS